MSWLLLLDHKAIDDLQAVLNLDDRLKKGTFYPRNINLSLTEALLTDITCLDYDLGEKNGA